MNHHNTVFSQLLKLIPRHDFKTLAKQHHQGRSFQTASRWSQFVSLAAKPFEKRGLMALLRGAPLHDSLPDINQMVLL